MTNTTIALRAVVQDNLTTTQDAMNEALKGINTDKLEPVLKRLGRGGKLPHWYEKLKSDGTLPNLDGKTVGSVVEMILVAVLETKTLAGHSTKELRINPARGIDLPDLDLGVKSPSENYCTSEPFFLGTSDSSEAKTTLLSSEPTTRPQRRPGHSDCRSPPRPT